MVEARGVEPLSERTATKVSPSAADIFVSLIGRLSAGFPQLSLLVFPTVSPGIKKRPVSLLCDARYWSAGQTRRTGCLIKQPVRIRYWQLFVFHRFTGRWNPGSLPLLLIPPSKPVRPQLFGVYIITYAVLTSSEQQLFLIKAIICISWPAGFDNAN